MKPVIRVRIPRSLQRQRTAETKELKQKKKALEISIVKANSEGNVQARKSSVIALHALNKRLAQLE